MVSSTNFLSTSSLIDICHLSFLVGALFMSSDSLDRPLGSYTDFTLYLRACLKGKPENWISLYTAGVHRRECCGYLLVSVYDKTQVTNNKFLKNLEEL